MGFLIRGLTGRLYSGGRLVARLGVWELSDLPGQRRGTLKAQTVMTNPAYWGQTEGLKLELDLGAATIRGTARIERDTKYLEIIVEDLNNGT